MSDNNTYHLYSAADIRRYHNGQMTAAEMYALEKLALEDPFLADAIEGYAGITEAAIHMDLAGMRSRLTAVNEATEARVIPMNARQSSKKIKWWKPGIAAALTGLLIFAGIKLGNRPEKENGPVAAKVESNTPKATATAAEPTNTAADTTVTSGLAATTTTTAKTNRANGTIVFVKPDSIVDFYNNKQKALLDGEAAKLNVTGAKKEDINNLHYDLKTDNNAGLKGYYTPVADSTAFVSGQRSQVGNGVLPGAEMKKITAKPAPAPAQNRAITPNNDNERFRNMNEQISASNTQDNVRSANNSRDFLSNMPVQRKTEDLVKDKNASNAAGAYNFSFNYRVTDASGNNIPYSNITVPAENLVTYSWVDGRFRLPSEDSVLNVTVKAAGYMPKELTLRSNSNWSNIVLTEANMAQKDVVVVGDQKNHALKKKSGMIAGTLNEAEPADGWETYDTYLANNIDAKNKPRGDVELSFTLNKQGEPVNITVAKSLSSEADEEAVRLLTKGPKWKARKKKTKGKVVVTFSPTP